MILVCLEFLVLQHHPEYLLFLDDLVILEFLEFLEFLVLQQNLENLHHPEYLD